MSRETCKGTVPWGNFGRTRPCRKYAAMDGWCPAHHPQLKADRLAARIAEERKQYDKRTKEYERQAAIPRKARELCERILNRNDGLVENGIREAMARELLSLLGEDAK